MNSADFSEFRTVALCGDPAFRFLDKFDDKIKVDLVLFPALVVKPNRVHQLFFLSCLPHPSGKTAWANVLRSGSQVGTVYLPIMLALWENPTSRFFVTAENVVFGIPEQGSGWKKKKYAKNLIKVGPCLV